jgi:hypothetical protein
VAPISCTIIWWLTGGLPHRFMVMKANSRCSIRFHLLVPAGRWVNAIFGPFLLVRRWSARFHSFTCESLLPQQSAVIVRKVARG